MSDDEWCSDMVQGDWGRSYPCSKRGKVERDGKWYCMIHDPERVAARRAKQDAERKAKWEAREAQWKRDRRIKELRDLMVERYCAEHPTSEAVIEYRALVAGEQP